MLWVSPCLPRLLSYLFDEKDILLQKSANVNISDAFGNTPLHSAAAQGFDDIVEALLENAKDIDLDAKNVEEYPHTTLVLSIVFLPD